MAIDDSFPYFTDALVGLRHDLVFLIDLEWAALALLGPDSGVWKRLYLQGYFTELGRTKSLLA
jgi:hypothetical protein